MAQHVTDGLEVLLAAEDGLPDDGEVMGAHSADEHQVLAASLDVRPHRALGARVVVVLDTRARAASRLLSELEAHLAPETQGPGPGPAVLVYVLHTECHRVHTPGLPHRTPRASLALKHGAGQEGPRGNVVGQVPHVRARLSEVGRLQGLGKLRGKAPGVREPRRGSPRYPSGTFQKRGRSEGWEVGEVLPPKENARVCPLEGHGGRHGITLGTPHRTPENCGQQQSRARPQSRDHTPGQSRAVARASTWRLCPVATSYHRTAPAPSSRSAYTAHFPTGVFGVTPIWLFLTSKFVGWKRN